MCFTKKRMLSLLLTLCIVIGLMPLSVFAVGADEGTTIIDVPQDAMVIENEVYYGISKSWFEMTKSNKRGTPCKRGCPQAVVSKTHCLF